MKVRMIIESTWHGLAKRDGVAMWLIEYMKDGVPITRQGFIHQKDCTENVGCLMALINAFHVLKKPCEVQIIVQCGSLKNNLGNRWYIRWKENGWINQKGKEVKNQDLWEMLIQKSDPHTFTVEDGHHDYQNVMQAAVVKEFKEWNEKCQKA